MIADCIVVGLDDSAGSRAAHRWAAAYANATGKDLRAPTRWPAGLATAPAPTTRLTRVAGLESATQPTAAGPCRFDPVTRSTGRKPLGARTTNAISAGDS